MVALVMLKRDREGCGTGLAIAAREEELAI